MDQIEIKDEFIKLGQALKLAGIAESGVDAKIMIEEETVEKPDSQWERPIESHVGFSDFHDCVGKNVGELHEVKRNDRICVAAKMCGRKNLSKEDAIRDCMEGDRK